mmetsp:Transcript_44884/g.113736  ORF Transcript_44884/g.113736 Transcript_44884/m.113736 type:complete len:228 (-) Transcript_44884:410-1093(-)
MLEESPPGADVDTVHPRGKSRWRPPAAGPHSRVVLSGRQQRKFYAVKRELQAVAPGLHECFFATPVPLEGSIRGILFRLNRPAAQSRLAAAAFGGGGGNLRRPTPLLGLHEGPLRRRELVLQVPEDVAGGPGAGPHLLGRGDVRAADAERLAGEDDPVAFVGHAEVEVRQVGPLGARPRRFQKRLLALGACDLQVTEAAQAQDHGRGLPYQQARNESPLFVHESHEL